MKVADNLSYLKCYLQGQKQAQSRMAIGPQKMVRHWRLQSTNVCFKTEPGQLPAASLPLWGQVTKHTTYSFMSLMQG